MKKTYINLMTIGFFLLLVFVVTVVLTSCGNMSIGFGNYSFKRVHVDTHGYSGCFEVDKWYDNEAGGIEVKTKDHGAMYLSEGSYILIEEQCPICDKVED